MGAVSCEIPPTDPPTIRSGGRISVTCGEFAPLLPEGDMLIRDRLIPTTRKTAPGTPAELLAYLLHRVRESS